MRSVDIIATLGQACEERLADLIRNGMTVGRLNFSHETTETHLRRLRLLREAGRAQAMADLRGPEVRLVTAEPVPVTQGRQIIFSFGGTGLTVTNASFLAKLEPGMRVLVDDGMVELDVNERTADGVVCTARADGNLKPRKTVAAEGVTVDGSALVPEDRETIRLARRAGMDWIAVSHVKTAEDMEEARSLAGGTKIMAKVENAEALRHIEEIIQASDGVMVARGDLGVNIPLEQVPLVQERVISLCRRAGVFSVVATQMMESMMTYPRPSRAEVTDVWNAVRQGADAVMLSGETAVGKHPTETVAWMRRVAEAACQVTVEAELQGF